MRKALLFLVLSTAYLTAQTDPARLQRYFQQGQQALAEGRYAEAQAAFEKLRDLEPGIAEIHASLGVSYFQQEKFEPAVAALRQALKLNPRLETVDVLLAMCLAELGNYTEALPSLEKGFLQSSDTALRRSAGLRLQRAYTGLARDREAVATALSLTELYPKDPEILYHGSRIFANYAFLTLRALSDAAPTSVWRRQAQGEAYESEGNHQRAVEEYRQVLALDPDRPGIHFRIGRSLLALAEKPGAQVDDMRSKAAEEFSEELRVDPTNANAAYELGEIRRKAERFEQARQSFELAVKYYPDFEDARIGLAKTLISLGSPEAALPHLLKAVALNPANEVAHYRLSQVYRTLGETSKQKAALAEFRRLHREQELDQETRRRTFWPREVTRQQLDDSEHADGDQGP